MKTVLVLSLLQCCLISDAVCFDYIVPDQKIQTTVRYSCGGDPMLNDSFVRMFSVWNFSCDNIFTLIRDDKTPQVSVVYSGSVAFPNVGETLPLGNSAVVFISGYPMFINPAILDTVMLHEIGHVLGMGHSYVQNSIMLPTLKSDASLIQDDIDGIRAHYNLSPKLFSWRIREHKWSLNAKAMFGKGKSSFVGLGNGENYIQLTYMGISFYEVIVRGRKQ